MISLVTLMIFKPLQKSPKNVEDLGKLSNCCAHALKSCPKSNKLPNLVTLLATERFPFYENGCCTGTTPTPTTTTRGRRRERGRGGRGG